MNKESKPWVLPDGVEQLLPKQAEQLECYRRQVLDLCASWGYQLVEPPMIDFSEALVTNPGSTLDDQTIKTVDQLSGKSLAVRADITPQIARIDACHPQANQINRWCYAGTVVHARPRSQLASRLPVQMGAELFGSHTIESDQEVLHLMLTSICLAGVAKPTLDIGHIGLLRKLIEYAQLSNPAAKSLHDAINCKAQQTVETLVSKHVRDATLAAFFTQITRLYGSAPKVLTQARALSESLPADIAHILDEVEAITHYCQTHFPDIPIGLDFSDLQGYDYHTGLVFAVYLSGVGHAVANGGRYDTMGESFGRSRPATGFNLDAKALLHRQLFAESKGSNTVYAPSIPTHHDHTLTEAIATLRDSGSRVIRLLPDEQAPDQAAQLKQVNGAWVAE